MLETKENPLMVDSVWTHDNFCQTFGFIPEKEGYSKEVKGMMYEFRPVRDPKELLRVLEIQRIAWSWNETDLAPTHILALMEDTGGGIIGAFNKSGPMIGFAAGFGGGKDTLSGGPAIISSMLAVAGESYRGRGIGKELKIIQAFYAYRNGYQVMKWFYDPERGENASLNLTKLGARAEEFHINKYGQMDSGLYGPVPTDRFRAVWRFTKQSVIDRITGVSAPPAFEDIQQIPITTLESRPDTKKVLVQISGDIDLENNNDKIKRRYALREILSYYFWEKRYIATEFVSGFSNDSQERFNFYVLAAKELEI